MARQRDFKAEYARRIARGAARGLTRQEARRGRAPEHPGRPVAPTRRAATPPRARHTEALPNGRRRGNAPRKREALAVAREMERFEQRRLRVIGQRKDKGDWVTLVHLSPADLQGEVLGSRFWRALLDRWEAMLNAASEGPFGMVPGTVQIIS